MNLFNQKTLQRHLDVKQIPAEHHKALSDWAELISSKCIFSLKEVSLHGQFTSKIVEGVLGYRGPVGGAEYTVATEQVISRGSVDLALGVSFQEVVHSRQI